MNTQMASRAAILLFALLVFWFTGSAQDMGTRPVSATLASLSESGPPTIFRLFSTVESRDLGARHSAYVRDQSYLTIDQQELRRLHTEQPILVQIPIPGLKGAGLTVYYQDIFAAGYTIRTSGGGTWIPSDIATYRGIVDGNPNSVAVVTVFRDEIRIMFSDESGVKRVQLTDNGLYVSFDDQNLIDVEPKECYTDDEAAEPIGQNDRRKFGTRSTGNCVEVYIECDNESYEDNNSSVTETEEWVAALWNEVSTLYDNESIPVEISEIMVWTTTDPYANLNSTSALLNEFVDQINENGYNGRLAHLFSTRSLGGGIAYLNVLCSTTIPCAVSASLSTNIQPFPNYSWNVTVVSHEMGHNFGSNHTHRCVWNGNNTQIDDCGNVWADNNNNNPEGSSCFDENDPILPPSGTIMSYCHLISGVGINFNNGFGQQPGDLLRSKFENASCNTGECGPPECTMLVSPADGATGVETQSTISWQSTGATGYKISLGTSPGGTQIEDELDVGNTTSYDPGGLPFNSTIYVTIIPYNNTGEATGCEEESFSTEPNVQPACTELDTPADGELDVNTDVVLEWSHAFGNQLGYRINIGVTPGGGEIANDVNVGNTNSYDPGGLLPDTTIYVRVTPYGTQGDVPGCPVTSFETEGVLGGDFCSGAVPISCGQTLDGSTEEATYDQVSNCGTSVTAPGVWYTFEGDGSNITVSLCGAANYDSKLSVYRGSCNQLTCVTGVDDTPGCGLTSQVSFTSLDGWQYFILVHGYSSGTGDFSITLACTDPPFCPSQSFSSADEWISEFTLGSFSNSSGAAQYSDFMDIMIDALPGEEYGVSITPQFLDDEYNEYFRIWLDVNDDGDFGDSGEKIFEEGPSSDMVTGQITIPSTLAPGEYRLRVAMKYNQFASPCEIFTYGEVEEYTLRVVCRMVVNTSDSGPGSLRDILECVNPGDTVMFSPTLNGQVISLTSDGTILNSDVVIFAQSGQNITVEGDNVIRIFRVLEPVDVEIHGLTIRGGTSNLGSCIRNYGALTLMNVNLKRNPFNNTAVLLDNRGDLRIQGNCDIEDQ